ncbi:MAG: hypothetical protein LBQ66_05395 [Planctomycetaceae bacterium]|nr:hypothetical protein [Planctomycetaceae bacterium]
MSNSVAVFAQLPYSGPPIPGVHPGAQYPGVPGAPVVGYYQPVKINSPSGTQIAFAVDNTFVERKDAPYTAGLLLGANYRFRVTNIRFNPGKEVFPTVTVLQRTFPPKGKETEYPIQIDITHEDLELALNGQFVTRVIYLEEPQSALPIRADFGQQPTIDVKSGEDPLRVAHSLGKPVAVVQIGGRIPNSNKIEPAFFHGSPAWIFFDKDHTGKLQPFTYNINRGNF